RDLVRRAGPLRAALSEEVLGGAAPERGDRVRRAERRQAVDRGAHDVDRVRGARRLAEQVADAGGLDHRPHRTAGDDTGAGAGRLEHHVAGAEVPANLVRDRGPDERHLDQVLLRVLDALADRLGYLAGL